MPWANGNCARNSSVLIVPPDRSNYRPSPMGGALPEERTSLIGDVSRAWTAIAYAVLIAVAIALFFLIRTHGEHLIAPPSPESIPNRAAAPPSDLLGHVLLALAVITIFARLVGRAFEKYLRQPPVMGEIVAGIMLGPSVLGAISPDAYGFVIPPAAAPHLAIL